QPRFERRNWRSPWLLCIRGHNARSLNQLFNHQKIFSQLCSHRHDTTRVDTWIRTALERFLELHLESACLHGMKTESFTSNTLVKLTLSNGFFLFLVFLLLMAACFSQTSKRFLSFRLGLSLVRCMSISSLAALWMVVNQSIAVSSPSIKRMSISYPSRDYWEPPASEVFRTPSLVYLDHSARLDLRRERVLAVEEDGIDDSSDGGWDEDVYDEDGSCFGVEHNAEVHDDVIDDYDDAADDDDDSDSDSDGEDSLPDVANLVEGISNVKTLHLSPYFLEVVIVVKKKKKCGDACVCIAKKKKMEEEEKVCCLSTCQVKVLNISGYGGTGRERKQMRHFLGNLKCLETVKVGLVAENHHEDNSVNNHYQRITNALTKLPRVSSNCQIHFF
ncbi:unnamed protein product, partial [Brassica oleracea var. botrytis]